QKTSVLVYLIAITSSLYAAKPAPAPVPPSTMIVGTFTSTGPAFDWFHYSTGSEVYSRPANVPADGAWIYGNASWDGNQWMDCDHHYKGTLSPNTSAYDPLFMVGTTAIDAACFGYNCYSCSFNFNGEKGLTYLTSDTYPAFLPNGSTQLQITSLNGGTGNDDNLTMWLAQVNRVDMTSMTLFQSISFTDPRPAQPAVVTERTFYAETDDRVPVVPLFHRGTETFPAGPGMTYSAKWDNGLITTPEVNPTLVLNGHAVVTVPVPKITTGTHSFILTATLPGGKPFTASMSVFVFAKSVFIDVDNQFNAASPSDDLPFYVPGSDRNGFDVPIKTGAPQIIKVHIVAGKGFSGDVKVEILDPSGYPGISMNYPKDSIDVTPDVDFGSPTTLAASQPLPKGSTKQVTFPLYVRDYAAKAVLHVTMTYGKKTFDFRQPLPRDVDGNGFPDAGWKVGTTSITETGMNPGTDGDTLPGMPVAIPPGETNGDGDNLTNFEEYRGFVLNGQHQRTHPEMKDYFVDVTVFGGDMEFIPILLPTSAHTLDMTTEAGSDGEINHNTDSTVPGSGDSAPNGHHFQNAKKVMDGGTAPPILGFPTPRFGDNECYDASGPCVPNTTGDVIVYMTDMTARATTDGKDAAQLAKLRRNTVAHEAGHSMNLFHVTDLSCLMYGAGFTAQGAWNNLPDTICRNVTTTIYECPPCGATETIENIPNFTETDSLRIKPTF
ncbi:MAG TPA: hypothetical protein VF215_12875, partial [Thermoanaerobaculia bacterium]